MVYYLKYRPSTLDELDNSDVATLLKRYLLSKNIPHAFLFSGPRGTGKTSTARILAKSLNCTGNKTPGVACGTCDVCLGIARGELLDILEIDAASNRGIDEIRDLREKIKLAPLHLTYKVYIIDEVHMLTNEAFNALLKTLEEPPAHAVFVLATTELHKVPGTVVSRCIKIEFKRATSDQLVHSLKRIVKGEKLAIDEDALKLIAEIADGSFRDGAKLLQEVALEGGQIDERSVRAKLGSSERVLEDQFLVDLRAKRPKEMLLIIQTLVQDGKNIRQFFMSILHALEAEFLRVFQGQKSEWKKEDLIRALKFFTSAFTELKTAVLPHLPFEIAAVEYCEGVKVILPQSTPTVVPPPVSIPSNLVTPQTRAPLNMTGNLGPFAEHWDEILLQLKPHNHSLVGILRSCRPLSFVGNTLKIEAGFKFHADRLADPRVRDILAKVINEITGLTVKIEVVSK